LRLDSWTPCSSPPAMDGVTNDCVTETWQVGLYSSGGGSTYPALPASCCHR